MPTNPITKDYGRTSRCYVSGYVRDRTHSVRLIVSEKRDLVADFNGAMDAVRKIVKARWRTDFGYITTMSNAVIADDQRSTKVTATANWIGDQMFHLEATLDNGEVLTQMYYISVSGNPWFLPSSTIYGPPELIVTYP